MEEVLVISRLQPTSFQLLKSGACGGECRSQLAWQGLQLHSMKINTLATGSQHATVVLLASHQSCCQAQTAIAAASPALAPAVHDLQRQFKRHWR
jgi:hypothetical protein